MVTAETGYTSERIKFDTSSGSNIPDDILKIQKFAAPREREGTGSSSMYVDAVAHKANCFNDINKAGINSSVAMALCAIAMLPGISPGCIPDYRIDKSSTIGMQDTQYRHAMDWTTFVPAEHVDDESVQPRFSHASAVNYAKRMGLPTDFPL